MLSFEFLRFISLTLFPTVIFKNILVTPEFGTAVAMYTGVLSITVRVGYAAGTGTHRG